MEEEGLSFTKKNVPPLIKNLIRKLLIKERYSLEKVLDYLQENLPKLL